MVFLDKSTLTYPATSSFPGRFWLDTRDPVSGVNGDYRQFKISDIWINENTNAWLMIAKTATSGTWIEIATTLMGLDTLTGNTGGAVGVDASNNINIIGAGDLTVTGNPGTNTLTISQSGVVATSYVENSGTAIPAGGILNVLGGTGISTVGSGNTVTINATGAVPLTFTENAGSATPALNNLNILGTGGVTTSGAGSTVTITTTGSVATLYTENSGTATPSGGNLNIVGGTGITTSGAGSTVTITATGVSITWSVISASQTLAVNHGYVCGSGGTLSLALPATSAVGDIIEVTLDGSTGWIVTQAAGQQIRLGNSTSTLGVGGSLASTDQGDTLRMVCRTANTLWVVLSTMGNITVV